MKVTSRTQPVAVLMVLTTLPACVPVVELAGAFADVPTVSRPQVTHTDRNPIPVSLPERVGDRLVFEPVERSEKAAEVFQWVGDSVGKIATNRVVLTRPVGRARTTRRSLAKPR